MKRLAESSTEVTDEGLADVATVSAGNNRVVRLLPAHPQQEHDQFTLLSLQHMRAMQGVNLSLQAVP